MGLPKIIAIVGTTASGKTDWGIKLARKYNGEVISADSRTVYKEMNIGTAKPEGEKKTAAELDLERLKPGAGIQEKGIRVKMEDLFQEKPFVVEGVPHWGFDLVNPDESFTVSDFKRYAEEKIRDIISRGKVPILVGGTGLYVKAIVDNLQFTDAKPNDALRKELETLSEDVLRARLSQLDPVAYETVDIYNRRRITRAIEVIESTGKPLQEQQTQGDPEFDVLQIGIDIHREVIYRRIEDRVDKMVAEGLVDEVRALRDKYGCEVNAMTGIGYRQVCLFLEGYIKLRDAIDLIKRDTRHYAKRQLTWFKRDKRIEWVVGYQDAERLAQNFLK